MIVTTEYIDIFMDGNPIRTLVAKPALQDASAAPVVFHNSADVLQPARDISSSS